MLANQQIISMDDQDKAINAVMQVALSNKHTRRELVNQSIRFFSQYYFNITLGEHQARWIKKLVKVKKGMILGPCGHGKTEIYSKLLLAWLICRNREVRILLCSKSDGLAVKNLKNLGRELEENVKLIQDFGRFYNPSATWTDHQLYCIRSKGMKDPTIEAVGLLGAITGGRFDVIVLDDVLDVLNTRSEEQREKVKDYINGTLIPRLEPWGVCWGIGTRKHYNDYYSELIKNKAWVTIVDQAIVREPKEWKVIESDEPVELIDSLGEKHEVYFQVKITSEDRGECLWPQKWPMENLLLLRYTIGSTVFEREYQNKVLSDESALFKIGWLEKAKDENLTYIKGNFHEWLKRNEFTYIVQGTDPSLVDDRRKAERTDSDYSVITSWGLDKTGNRVLLGLWRERGVTPAKIEEAIEIEYRRFEPEYHFLESNSFGTIYAHNLINKRGLRLTKHHTDRRKDDLYVGIPGMAVSFENGKVRLPYKTESDRRLTDAFITEFHGLGSEKHDDIVMSTWIAWTGIERLQKGLSVLNRSITRVQKPNRAGLKRD